MRRSSLGRDKISFRGGLKNPGLRQDFVGFREAHGLKVAEINVNDIFVDSFCAMSFTTSLRSVGLLLLTLGLPVETLTPPNYVKEQKL